jgi:hypothetical protein
MSDNTLNKALWIMGYNTGPGGDHCAHGFRSTGIRVYKMGGKTMIDLDSVDEYHASPPRVETRAS